MVKKLYFTSNYNPQKEANLTDVFVTFDYNTTTKQLFVVDKFRNTPTKKLKIGTLDQNGGSINVSTLTGLSQLQNDVGYITSADLPEGSIYTAGEGLKLDGHEFNLTGTILSGSEHISIANNVISLIGDIGKTYTQGTGVTISGEQNIVAVDQEWLEGFVANLGYVKVENDQVCSADEETILMTGDRVLSVNTNWLNNLIEDKGYLVNSDLQGLASEQFVITNTSGKVNKSDFNTVTSALSTAIDSKVTSTQVKDQVEAYGYQNATDVANAISGKADKSELQSVSGILNTAIDVVDTKADTNTNSINDLTNRVQTIEDDYIKSADMTATSAYINSVSTALNNVITSNVEDMSALCTKFNNYDTSTQVTEKVNAASANAYNEASSLINSTSATLTTSIKVVDDKFTDYYNKTTVDGMFESTSTYIQTVSSNIEGDITSTYNNLTGKINTTSTTLTAQTNYLSGQIDNIKANYTTSTYVNQQVNNLATGQVATNTSNISQLNEKFNNLDNKVDTKADTTELNNYATKEYVQAASGNAVNVATGWVEGKNYITIDQVPEGTVYSTGFGLAISGENNNIFYLTGTVLSGGTNIEIVNNKINNTLVNISQLTNNVGYITSGQVDTKINIATSGKANKSDVNDYFTATSTWINNTFKSKTDSSTEYNSLTSRVKTIENDYTTSNQVDTKISNAISSKANKSDVDTQFTATSTYVNNTFETKTNVNNLTGRVKAIEDNYTTSGQASAIVTGYINDVSGTIRSGLATPDQITLIGVKVNGTALTPTNKVVDITVPITNVTVNGTSVVSNKVAAITVPTDYITGVTFNGSAAIITNKAAVINNVVTVASPTTNQFVYKTNNGYATSALNNLSNNDVSGIVQNMSGSIINGLAKTSDIPTNYTTSAQVSSIVTSYGYITGIQNNALISDVQAASGNAVNIATGWVNNQNYLTNQSLNNYYTKGEIQTVTGNIINNIPTYTGINGISVDPTTHEVSITGQVGKTYTPGDGIAIDNNNKISLTANISQLTNDVGYITIEDVKNKQRILHVNGDTITYNSDYQIFKTNYNGGTVVLNLVTLGANDNLAENEITTIEQWITFSSDVTDVQLNENLILVGALPGSLNANSTHVFVRRIINDNGTIKQCISYAYEF